MPVQPKTPSATLRISYVQQDLRVHRLPALPDPQKAVFVVTIVTTLHLLLVDRTLPSPDRRERLQNLEMLQAHLERTHSDFKPVRPQVTLAAKRRI